MGCYDTNTMCIQNTEDIYDKVNFNYMNMIKKMNSKAIQEISNYFKFVDNTSL